MCPRRDFMSARWEDSLLYIIIVVVPTIKTLRSPLLFSSLIDLNKQININYISEAVGMCYCYVPFRGGIYLMIFLCFPLRFATSQAKMAGELIRFPQHVPGVVLLSARTFGRWSPGPIKLVMAGGLSFCLWRPDIWQGGKI
jgi:hypothetical protein